jgi:hypothetical protein
VRRNAPRPRSGSQFSVRFRKRSAWRRRFGSICRACCDPRITSTPAAHLHCLSGCGAVGRQAFRSRQSTAGDRALQALLGLDRFPTDDTIRNLFRRFGMGQVQRLYEPLTEWQMQRLPPRADGYTRDLDSTSFEFNSTQPNLAQLLHPVQGTCRVRFRSPGDAPRTVNGSHQESP